MYYISKSIYLTSSAYTNPNSWYLKGIDTHQSQPTSYNTVPTTTIWTVAKTASGSYSSMTASTIATVFGTANKPDGGLNPLVGEGWVFGPYTGVFAKDTMSLSMSFTTTQANNQAGRFTYRLWKASDVSGSNASLITPSKQYSSIGIITALRVITGSFILTNPVVMNNEYMFLETAWAITTQGGNPSCNIIFNAGSSSKLITGPFEDNTVFITGDDNPGYFNFL